MATGLNEQLAGESAHAMPSRDLGRKFYPDVPAGGGIAYDGSLVSNQKEQRMLGFALRHRWPKQPQG